MCVIIIIYYVYVLCVRLINENVSMVNPTDMAYVSAGERLSRLLTCRYIDVDIEWVSHKCHIYIYTYRLRAAVGSVGAGAVRPGRLGGGA